LLYFGGCDEQKTCFSDIYTARLKFSTHRPSCPDNSGEPGVNTPLGFAMECPMNCSGNGICHQGTCFCDPGFDGADCGRALSCPSNCSHHGLCKNGRCYCDPGLKGSDCSIHVLCSRNCSYRGVCHNGRCECDPGYSGIDCSKVVVCPSNCTKRGICLNGACFCSPGFGEVDVNLNFLVQTIVQIMEFVTIKNAFVIQVGMVMIVLVLLIVLTTVQIKVCVYMEFVIVILLLVDHHVIKLQVAQINVLNEEFVFMIVVFVNQDLLEKIAVKNFLDVNKTVQDMVFVDLENVIVTLDLKENYVNQR